MPHHLKSGMLRMNKHRYAVNAKKRHRYIQHILRKPQRWKWQAIESSCKTPKKRWRFTQPFNTLWKTWKKRQVYHITTLPLAYSHGNIENLPASLTGFQHSHSFRLLLFFVSRFIQNRKTKPQTFSTLYGQSATFKKFLNFTYRPKLTISNQENLILFLIFLSDSMQPYGFALKTLHTASFDPFLIISKLPFF